MHLYTPDLTAPSVYDGGLDVYYACYDHTYPSHRDPYAITEKGMRFLGGIAE